MRERLGRMFLDGLRALLGARQAHRELLEQGADAIFLAGRDGRLVEVNERACEMVRSDGVRVPVEVSTRLLSDGRLQGIARDITSRRVAYAALRRSEERLRLALETAGIGIWERDHSTGDAVWSALARAHLDVSDAAPSEFETFLEHVHPDDKHTVHSAIAMAHDRERRVPLRVPRRTTRGRRAPPVQSRAGCHGLQRSPAARLARCWTLPNANSLRQRCNPASNGVTQSHVTPGAAGCCD